jgi:hypothetical protein
MSRYLANALSIVLIAIGLLHLYWGLGGFWPGHDEASLVDMVIGMPAGTPVPPFWACAIVAACVSMTAGAALIIAYGLAKNWPMPLRWIPMFALWFSAFVFLARGISTYVSPLVSSAKGTAFYELDRIIYAPLCLVFGFSLIAIWFFRARTGSAS